MTRDELRSRGMEALKNVALRYAAQHGLQPEVADWVLLGGDEWWLKIVTARQSVKVVFSPDELEDFGAEGPGARGSKLKIRNAFAGLSM